MIYFSGKSFFKIGVKMKAIVFLADGFEEIEALTPVDYLRRAGVKVTVAGISKQEITGAHGINVMTDEVLSEGLLNEKFDALIIPGGMPGSTNLAASPLVEKFLKDAQSRGAVIAAICAAPVVVLAKSGFLKKRRYTCYPSMEKDLQEFAGKDYKVLTEGSVHTEERVVTDGNIVTSRGPGAAEEFALVLVEKLAGKEAKDSLRKGIVAR